MSIFPSAPPPAPGHQDDPGAVSRAPLLALVAAILVCEAIGWPFLVGPVQQRLAAVLDRRVAFGNDPAKSSGVHIGLLGSVRVRADSIEIGPPRWSQARHTLLARDAVLKLGYLDLWRAWRGRTLHVKSLEAAELVRRRPHPTDKRTTLVEVTDAGRTRCEEATASVTAVDFGLVGLADEEVSSLTGLLAKVRHAAGDFS